MCDERMKISFRVSELGRREKTLLIIIIKRERENGNKEIDGYISSTYHLPFTIYSFCKEIDGETERE